MYPDNEDFNWEVFLVPYQQAVNELEMKFSALKAQYEKSGELSLIHYVHSRVKSIDSILEKAKKHNVPLEEIDYKLKDIAGIRLVTQFEEDILLLVKLIQIRTDMRVVLIKDYFTNPKESGYKSMHIVIEYDVNTVHGAQTVLCEIQLRTLAMDFWASIEHSLRYKYKEQMPEDVRKRLVKAAQGVTELDSEMGEIRDEITDAQKLFAHKSQLASKVRDSLNVLSKYGKRDAVKHYYKIYNEMREQDNMLQLSLLEKELEKEISEVTIKAKEKN